MEVQAIHVDAEIDNTSSELSQHPWWRGLFSAIAVKTVVIGVGLAIGLFVGLFIALCAGLLDISC